MGTAGPVSKEWLLDVTKALLRRCGAQMLETRTHDPRLFEQGEGGLETSLRQAFLLVDGDVRGTVREAGATAPEGLHPIGMRDDEVLFSWRGESQPHGGDVVLAVTAWWRSESGLRVADASVERQLCAVTAVMLGFGRVLVPHASGSRSVLSTEDLCYLLAVRSLARGDGWFAMWRLRRALPRSARAMYIESLRGLLRPYGRLAWRVGLPNTDRFGEAPRLEIGPHGLRHAPDEEDSQ